MNSVSEALNTLISAVNLAYNKGGVYSMEESHYIYMAISYLHSLSQEQNVNQNIEDEDNNFDEMSDDDYPELDKFGNPII